MIEYNYVECSSAVMQGLGKFSSIFPDHRKEDIEHKKGQVINTAWALLGLMAARYPDKKTVEKGIARLIKKQDTNGDWEKEGISRVFNGNCMEVYIAYRNVFPLWALGRYVKSYKPDRT